ncbi:DUF3108 domain-containing protein [Polaromonas sp. SM01]|uniref:DUF3108 domain-containing protein n=1 Tax=Polaromonas sp. SM01 TaxID=3085630 RepID=UPI0029820B87|nr:DUF3108 domain-containing protein [Polaromonas sp. SM01]MDW5442545.1 DUF3108 domain-containing protein [Polaromonas sp. SM01]
MNTGTALPPRRLIVLTAIVVLVHVLILQAAPSQWGMAADPGKNQRPFITRTIDIKPAPVVAAAAPMRPPIARRSAPKSQPNKAPAIDTYTQAATESIATPDPGNTQAASEAATVAAAEPTPAPPATAEPMAVATALTIPGSVRLKYTMTGRAKNMDYNASAELDWLQDGQTYEARMLVSALFLGSRSMSSSGRITADGLAPTRFLDKSRSERAAHFAPDQGKISFSANTPDAPWAKGAQDRVSVFVQLASLLAGDPRSYPAGSSVSLYTVGPTNADTWTFEVQAEETLKLPAGEMTAVKLTRKPQRDYDQTVEVWLAPSLAWLPVRSRITQHNGDFIDQQLRVAEQP